MAGRTTRSLRPADELSHYQVVSLLGAGGMGEVYLARDLTLGRNVALKILPADLTHSEDRVWHFELEAKAASSLSHPNIVTIYEIGQAPVRAAGEPESAPLHFIAMELVSGKTLATLIHEDKTDLRTLLGYLAQAADGIAKAHAAGIVHRDLKPGNIMVTGDGFAKVLDFGLAKLVERRGADADLSSAPTVTPDASAEGLIVGTAGYMSPEQVQGKAVDHRTDVFSFGCMLYEAATRRRPFAADTAVETMHKVLNDTPAPIETLNDKAPAELRRLIRRCLAKSPEQRLQSMKDLALQLRELVDEYATLSASASSGGSAAGAPAAASRRSPLALWLAVATAIVGLGAFAWWTLRPHHDAEHPAETMRVSPQTSRGDVTACALSPDGRYLAYLADSAGRTSLRIKQVATGSDMQVLPPTDARLGYPSFSPDGNYLFYLSSLPDNLNYRALFQVPSLGGPPQQRAFDVDSRASFAPDGKQCVFRRHVAESNADRLIVLDIDSGHERQLALIAVGKERCSSDPEWSADGKQVTIALERFEPTIMTTIVGFDVLTGRRTDLHELNDLEVSSLAWLPGDGSLVVAGANSSAPLNEQLYVHSETAGQTSRLTNDFDDYYDVSASHADGTVAAVRATDVSNLWTVDISGAAPRQLTTFAYSENSPYREAVGDSGTIMFTAPVDQVLQLWAMPTNGGAPQPRTNGAAQVVSLFANGGVAVFTRLDSTGLHLWRMNADGTDLRELPANREVHISDVSRDGRMVLYQSLRPAPAFTVVSTTDGQVLRSDHDGNGSIGFSPDGRSVLISEPRHDAHGLTTFEWRALPSHGGPAIATVGLPSGAMDIHWAPDGKALTFVNRETPHHDLYRQPLPSGPPEAITHLTSGLLTGHAWSPDGRRLALRILSGDAANLTIADADGSHAAQVTHFTAELIFNFQWFPDSRRVLLAVGTDLADAVLIRGVK